MAKQRDIRVIYILGYTRTGSTLLERLLSISPGTVAVGELAYLWEQRVRNDSYCGCGAKWSSCPFWRNVLASQPTIDFQQERSPEGPQFWSFFGDLYREKSVSDQDRYQGFLNQVESVYRGIAEETEGKVIIDSSKRPYFGLAASKIPGISVTFIHLVRDSRGCAFSWRKAKARKEFGKDNLMPRHPAHQTAVRWTAANLQAEILRGRGCGYIFLRYEDFVANPTVEVNRILDQLHLSGISAEEGVFHPPASHGTWGNPDRWSTANGIRITPDKRWITELTTPDFAITTLISAPLLKRYGYPLFRSSRSDVRDRSAPGIAGQTRAE